MSNTNWYIAYTHSRSERRVQSYFQCLNLESYLPLHTIKRQWSDRVKWVEVPLFSSYVFVKTTPDQLHFLRSVDGVARFLVFESKYATIKDREIELIKMIIKETKELAVYEPSFQKGDKVRITNGPLEGLEGMMIQEENKNRILVEITGIGKTLAVSIPAKSLVFLKEMSLGNN